MKSFTVSLSVLILLIGAAFSVTAAARTHYVRYGDTLWELSIYYYNTPFHWEDILNANPFLEGAEYLQPGSELILPDISGITITSGAYDSGYSGIYTTSGASSRLAFALRCGPWHEVHPSSSSAGGWLTSFASWSPIP